MKRSHIEQLKQRAKQFHQHHPLPLTQGLYSLHNSDRPDDALTYEASAIFLHNGYRVYLHWEHPRLRYMRRVEEQAWEQMPAQPTTEHTLWVEDSTSNYRNLSLASPQPLSWSSASHEARQAFYQQLGQQIQQVGQQSLFHISPELRSYWTAKGKVVELCCPVEVRTQDDLHTLVALAQQLLQGTQQLHSLYGDYRYTKDFWLTEFTSPTLAATPIMPE